MTESADDIICFCVGVRRGRIVDAVKAGAQTVEEVRRATHACSGCQSCWTDIEAIIAAASVAGDEEPS